VASGRTSTSSSKRYPDAPYRRFALAPGILGAIALLAGTLLLTSDSFTIIRYVAAILALIVGWFVIRARHWWWLPVLAAIVVLWNPVLPFDFSGTWWQAAQYVGAVLFLVIGIVVRERNTEDRNAQRVSTRR
jgi:hypothetical protein